MQLGAQPRLTPFSHPFIVVQDKNPGEKQAEATEKFKEVSEAYDVLTDPEKRKVGSWLIDNAASQHVDRVGLE